MELPVIELVVSCDIKPRFDADYPNGLAERESVASVIMNLAVVRPSIVTVVVIGICRVREITTVSRRRALSAVQGQRRKAQQGKKDDQPQTYQKYLRTTAARLLAASSGSRCHPVLHSQKLATQLPTRGLRLCALPSQVVSLFQPVHLETKSSALHQI